jgi:lysyl-tRNA synthetase class 2
MTNDQVAMTNGGISVEALEQRSRLLAELRSFFLQNGFVEVETPLLADEVIPELHIEPMPVESAGRRQWLQASPELHMKRLLAAGMQSIFQVTRSFRDHERGPLHHPEFTLVEWYRVGDDMRAGMDLLDQLCQALTKEPPAKRTPYSEAFRTHVDICPHTATADALAERTASLGINVPEGLQKDDRDEWLNLLLATCVEPQMGHDGPEILYDYPASQAALAKVVTREGGKRVAERFELYWRGVELANGYHELTDVAELRARLSAVNERRVAEGRRSLPMPESLLAAMERGLSACAGCALGFDRLAMLALGKSELAEVKAFGPGVD